MKLPPRSPNLSLCRVVVRTIKEGCLERMIFFGEDGLRKQSENSLRTTCSASTRDSITGC